jgi:multidrug resistance efflux pump
VAAAEALEARLKRISSVEGMARGEQEVRVSKLVRDAAALRAEGERIASVIAGLETEISQHIIRAPRAGVVVAVAEVTEGAVVSPGQWLATLVPPGDLRVLAQLDKEAAARVGVGQPARLEVDGYPWTQYGKIDCRVTGVSGDPSAEGAMTVFLAITGPAGRVPIRHGHSGRVEIEVEKVSPAIMALRAAGLVSRGDRH